MRFTMTKAIRRLQTARFLKSCKKTWISKEFCASKPPAVRALRKPETLDWISKGVIAATVAQKPYTMAFYGLRFLDDLHHNSVHEFKSWQDAPASPIPARVDTGTAVINSENVDDFKAALALGR